MERNYEDAIKCINSRRAKPQANLDQMRGSDDMLKWLEILGHSETDLKSLNVIHVAGTNGKGSTCAFIASMLKASGKKVGLYTSPHMLSIRERIRIGGEPISEASFTARFFEIWDKLPGEATASLDIPRYLQLLALLSFHVFIKEKVDVAIYETHMGGEYDATNVISSPVVTVVTQIAKDHVKYLGPAIEQIAWHKAGILKAGCPAFSPPQDETVSQVLQQRVIEKKAALTFVEADTTLPVMEYQRVNCSLAVAAVRAWISVKESHGQTGIDTVIDQGIRQFDWPGRYQEICTGKHRWFLDGAHNESSLPRAVKWFVERSTRQSDANHPVRILIFSHISDRDGDELLGIVQRSLNESGLRIEHVILTTYKESRDRQTRIDRNLTARSSPNVPQRYAKVWKASEPSAIVYCEDTIEDALQRAWDVANAKSTAHILITGSLHLISGVLGLLGPVMEEPHM